MVEDTDKQMITVQGGKYYDSRSTRCHGNRKQGHLAQTGLFKGGEEKDEYESVS